MNLSSQDPGFRGNHICLLPQMKDSRSCRLHMSWVNCLGENISICNSMILSFLCLSLSLAAYALSLCCNRLPLSSTSSMSFLLRLDELGSRAPCHSGLPSFWHMPPCTQCSCQRQGLAANLRNDQPAHAASPIVPPKCTTGAPNCPCAWLGRNQPQSLSCMGIPGMCKPDHLRITPLTTWPS